ncbi:hypothetical protein LSH36_7g15017 [Paralvinella palmiformis]|uniref:phosphatidylinositol-3,5-bisphosphate 3-phosphatase n=1 Tax=Paralvinella palmiformis TaxID=53620 RepID=A0AAD9KEB2_9ANNE|nr:hypothetical protein LSH36_7g15017 [Paralvinella palmiformis]
MVSFILSLHLSPLQAAICRCSQPLAGFSARCMEDEAMLQAIRKANPTSKFMYVVDTRPKILIEKEWLAFGHKFTDRCGFISTVDPKEISPVFTQFIDCVWQMSQQFPTAFQFNERYLLTLHDHVYSCQFGTFIGNCEKDRIDLRLNHRTYSLWAYLSKYRTDFTNPFYKKDMSFAQHPLIPDTFPQTIRFWRGMYCRFDSGVHPRENILDIVCVLKDHTRSMEDHCMLLEQHVANLYKLLGHNEAMLNRSLNMLSSSESMDFRAFLMSDSGIKSPPSDGSRKQLSPEANHIQGDGDSYNHRRESDTESGFEDNGSHMTSDVEIVSPLTHRSCDDGITENDVAGSLQIEQILLELQSHHCWRCGNIYCTRCIDCYMPLVGHHSKKPVPVCKACYKEIKHSPSPSVDDFQKLQQQLNKQSLS